MYSRFYIYRSCEITLWPLSEARRRRLTPDELVASHAMKVPSPPCTLIAVQIWAAHAVCGPLRGRARRLSPPGTTRGQRHALGTRAPP